MRRFILLSLLVLAVPACYQAPAPPLATKEAPDRIFDALLGLIRERLDVMHDVARWKWAKKVPVEDPEREAALLKDVAEKGVALGLDPEITRAFFRAQIEAAKIIQRNDLGRWELDGLASVGEAPDLAGVL
jgi:chorismate mutase